MGHEEQDVRAHRLLVFDPARKGAGVNPSQLADAGITCLVCTSVAGLCRAIEEGAGAVFVTEQALTERALSALTRCLSRQPAWSDMTVLVGLAGGARSALADAIANRLSNVLFLDQPVDPATLVPAVRVVLRARRRQYQNRAGLAERERLALALEKAEQRLMQAADAGRIGLFEWDVLRSEMSWPPQFASLLGYAPAAPASGATPRTYRDWVDRMHPDDVPGVEERLRLAMAEHRPWEAEYRVVWPDGTVHWLSTRGEFYYDADGQVTRMLGVAMDATQRIRADEALRESEQRYRMVADFTYDWESWIDPQDQVLYCSPSCQRITGHAASEFLADPGLRRRLIHPEDLARFDAHVRDCEKVRQPGEDEWRLVRPDGTCRWIAHACQPVFDERGQYLGVRSSSRDISDRKQAEDKLQESEERFRAFMDNSPTIAWAKDEEGRHVYLSAAYERRFGVRFSDWQGKTDSELWPEEMAREFRKNDLAVLNAGQTIEVIEETRNLDGSRCYWWNFKFPFQDATGRKYVGGIGVDITDRKRAEHDLQLLNESLEQRVAERIQTAQMLHDIATMANQAQSTEQAIEHCLRRVAVDNGWCFGHAFLRTADNSDELVPSIACYAKDPNRFRRFRELTSEVRLRRGQGLAGRVFASSKPEWTTDLRGDVLEGRAVEAQKLGLSFAMAFPVIVGQQTAGVLEFFSEQVIQPDARLSDAMTSVGMHLGRVIERADFQEHLLTIAEEIQRAIAQDLHDDVGQELTGLGLKAETLAEMLIATETPAKRLAADIAAAVERTRGKVRRFSRNMLPPELEQGLLAAALGQLAAATTAGSRIACTFDGPTPHQSFDSRVAIHLFRIAQEAVSNAVRHSGARRIRITLALDHEHGGTELRIEDDGTGMPSGAAHTGGMGLRTMRYRAELIGARLQVGPGPSGGMQVICQLAVNDSQRNTLAGR